MPGEIDDFQGEAREILDGLAADLVALEKNGSDSELVNRIFRGAHSLKGLAGMLGFSQVAGAAHKLESALDGVRMGRVAASGNALDVLLAAVDVLGRLIDGAKKKTPDAKLGAAWSEIEKKLETLEQPKSSEPAGPRRTIDPSIAKLLSEYESHRLQTALAAGSRAWRLDVELPFETFDKDLPAIKERLKNYGEVITTLAGNLSSPDTMGFGLLVVSPKDPSVLVVIAATPGARIMQLPVVELSPAPPMLPTPPPQEAMPMTLSSGLPELPREFSASSLPLTAIDWNALASEGEPGESPQQAAPAPLVDALAGTHAPAGGSATLRVNLERVDELMTLVGELVTAKNAISQAADRMKAELGFKGVTLDLFRAKRTLERRLEELSKRLMAVRMLPLDQLFGRLERVVRNLSRESGKEVELVVSGAETELDKVMIDELSDPLIHVVRNSVDHGIEALPERIARGKPAKGTIRITAAPRGNHVSIEVEDDGGGLDLDRIRQKGIEKGLLARDSTPSEEELFDLIYAPGFSTKEAVSEVSGRGVGMDVVKNNIMKLNGIIVTASERGKGTRFTITLPLTLATMKALVVGVGSQQYAIPLASVLECVRTRADEIRTVEGREVMPLREATLPLVRLARFFGFAADSDSEDDSDVVIGDEGTAIIRRMHVVVVGLAQYRIGLVVDRLGGQQDVVVKPLGEPISDLPGIMGATNLGNNQPVLVLDVAGVVNASVSPVRAAAIERSP